MHLKAIGDDIRDPEYVFSLINCLKMNDRVLKLNINSIICLVFTVVKNENCLTSLSVCVCVCNRRP